VGPGLMRWSIPLILLCLNAVAPDAQAAPGNDKPKVHVVYSGQRLASIAKRYNVTVDALCNANGISDREPIKPGQKLLVPPRDDKDGSRTRANNPALKPAKSEPAPAPSRPDAARTHKVESGQRLGSIAKRYGVTIDALCAANGIKRTDILRPGQILKLPEESSDKPETRRAEEPPAKAVKPGRAGYLELYTYTKRWRGQVIDKKGRLSPSAVKAISQLLGATGDRPRLDQRLIRLLVKVSDAFGGRPIRVVSGYRTTSFYEDSRHKLSRAIDFSIPGVSNATLRDYLRRFANAGVGYYPNSSFVHLDVREGAAYWVDYSGPGEAPRTRPGAPRKLAREDHDHDEAQTGHADHADHTDHVEHADRATQADAHAGETRPASLIREASEAAPRLPPLM